MTKRFTLTDWHEVKDKGKILKVNEVIDLMNELAEENEELRQKLGECHKKWNNSMDIARLNQDSTRNLLEENRELRQTIESYEYQIKKGYVDLTYEEMLEKESEYDE